MREKKEANPNKIVTANCLSRQFRLLGLLPLIFFIAYLLHFLYLGELGNILWMCHLSNLTLAFGLFFCQRPLVRVSVLWLVYGLPLWLWNLTEFGLASVTSLGTHLGGLAIGLIVLSKVRMERRIWLYALVSFLIVQQVCRLTTPAELNVNIAHSVYFGWESMFSVYGQYWLFTSISAGIGLWIFEIVLLKFWPPEKIVSDIGD
jgi:hypothetical protein